MTTLGLEKAEWGGCVHACKTASNFRGVFSQFHNKASVSVPEEDLHPSVFTLPMVYWVRRWRVTFLRSLIWGLWAFLWAAVDTFGWRMTLTSFFSASMANRVTRSSSAVLTLPSCTTTRAQSSTTRWGTILICLLHLFLRVFYITWDLFCVVSAGTMQLWKN